MKEKIYTIPVMDGFNEDCECPMCLMEKKLEDEYIGYYLGPSLMEPDCRIDTNEKGFCRRHFEMLYNSQENRLGLGLIIDTHMVEQTAKIKKIYESKADAVRKDAQMPMLKNLAGRITSRQTDTGRLADDLVKHLEELENKCTICGRIAFTMERYVDVILYLWSAEKDFKELFSKKKGFCLSHFKLLVEGTKKYLGPKEAAEFLEALINLQITNLDRVQKEVNWFTKKFDYRYNDAPWGNSRDAIPRSIQKLAGYCSLK